MLVPRRAVRWSTPKLYDALKEQLGMLIITRADVLMQEGPLHQAVPPLATCCSKRTRAGFKLVVLFRLQELPVEL